MKENIMAGLELLKKEKLKLLRTRINLDIGNLKSEAEIGRMIEDLASTSAQIREINEQINKIWKSNDASTAPS